MAGVELCWSKKHIAMGEGDCLRLVCAAAWAFSRLVLVILICFETLIVGHEDKDSHRMSNPVN